MRPLVALLIALLAPSLSATAVVIFRTPDRVILASDSLQQSTEGARVTICKVRRAGKWWLTVSGYTGSKSPPVDVWNLTTDAITPARTIAEAGNAIASVVFPRVSDWLKAARALKGFPSLFEAGAWVAQIVVAGVDGTTPTVGVLGIKMDAVEPFRVTPTWVVCPGRLCPDGRLYFAASVEGPSVALVTPPRPDWVERADSAAAFRIITAQIAATPRDVAPPIDVLELSARGAQWMNRDASSRCNPVTKG